MENTMKSKIILLSIISTLAILLRTIFKIAPNIELVTSLALLSGFLLPKNRIAFIFPLLVMLISDLMLGNSQIYLFTWSGFLLPVLLGQKLLTKIDFSNSKILNKILIGATGSVVSVIFFYLWTNLGVVLTSGMYEISLNGLILSYINALPFLKLQLAGNLIIAPMVFLSSELLLNRKVSAQVNQYSR
jgi:hypothetical protein